MSDADKSGGYQVHSSAFKYGQNCLSNITFISYIHLVDIIPCCSREVPVVSQPMSLNFHFKSTLPYGVTCKFCQ